MEWLRQLPRSSALLMILLTIFLIQSQVQCLQIRPHVCHNSLGDSGTCMFVWECIKTEGTHLGTCADGFLFGSCCAHNDSKNDIIPTKTTVISTETAKRPESTTTMSLSLSTFYSPSTLLHSTTVSPQSFTASSISYHTKPYPKPTYINPSSTTFRPIFIRPPFKPSSTTSNPTLSRPPSKPYSTTFSPTFIRPTYKPSSTAPNNTIIRTTSSPASTFKPIHIRPTIKPSYTHKPTHIRPSPTPSTSIPLHTRPTFKPASSTSKPPSITFKPAFNSSTFPPSSTTLNPVFTRPSYKPSSTTFRPIFTKSTSKTSTTPRPIITRPTSKTSTTFRPIITRPTSETSTTFRPIITRPTSETTTFRPIFTRPISKTTTTFRPIFTRPTSKTTTTFRPIFTRPTNKTTTTFRPIITRPTNKPPPSNKPAFLRPTSKPSSGVSSTTVVYQPVYAESNSGNYTAVIKTTENPSIKSTTIKYGYASVTDNWVYSTYQPSHVSTKQTTLSTKRPTHRPSVTYWTSNHPYNRPTWKPTSKPNFSNSSTSNPFIYTYSTNNYTTRPSFTPFSTKTSRPTSPPSSTSPFTTSSFTSYIKSTTTATTTTTTTTMSSSKPEVTMTSTTWRPITKPTESAASFIMAHFTRSTTPNVPFTKPSINGYNHIFTSTHGWFSPSTHTTPESTSPTTSFNTSQASIFWDVSLQDISTPAPQQSSSTTSTTTETANYSSEISLDSVTSSGTKSTTPLPVQPCGMPFRHPQKKVVGGKNSAFGSWPWQVSVRRTSFFGFSSTHRCGGALISRQWVATAGHCVDDLLLSQIKIRVGEYDFASVQEPHGYVERGVTKKVVHPRYNFFTYENDLALVQLEEPIDPIKYPHIAPICLPPIDESLVGKNATVTGWGRLSEGGVLPSILQEVKVPIISNEKCKNMFLAAGRHEYIPDIFMCAGFEEGGRDSCQGDSGGPLQIQADEGYWFLAGIISWGIGCAEPNMPGVCTRISKFKSWVVQQIT